MHQKLSRHHAVLLAGTSEQQPDDTHIPKHIRITGLPPVEGDFVTKQARFAFKNGSISFPRHAALCLDLFQYIDVSSQKGKDLKHLNTDVVKIKKDQKEENEEEMTQ